MQVQNLMCEHLFVYIQSSHSELRKCNLREAKHGSSLQAWLAMSVIYATQAGHLVFEHELISVAWKVDLCVRFQPLLDCPADVIWRLQPCFIVQFLIRCNLYMAINHSCPRI